MTLGDGAALAYCGASVVTARMCRTQGKRRRAIEMSAKSPSNHVKRAFACRFAPGAFSIHNSFLKLPAASMLEGRVR